MGYYRLSIIHADYGTDSKSLYRTEILINKIRKFQGRAGVQLSLLWWRPKPGGNTTRYLLKSKYLKKEWVLLCQTLYFYFKKNGRLFGKQLQHS